MANILLIGCGDVGLRLANNLIGIGHQLRIIKRSPLELAGATVINQDVSQPFSLSSLSPDYVFIILSPSASTPEAYQQVFMDGLKNIPSFFMNVGYPRDGMMYSLTFGDSHKKPPVKTIFRRRRNETASNSC